MHAALIIHCQYISIFSNRVNYFPQYRYPFLWTTQLCHKLDADWSSANVYTGFALPFAVWTIRFHQLLWNILCGYFPRRYNTISLHCSSCQTTSLMFTRDENKHVFELQAVCRTNECCPCKIDLTKQHYQYCSTFSQNKIRSHTWRTCRLVNGPKSEHRWWCFSRIGDIGTDR